jgi:hypothetical protein
MSMYPNSTMNFTFCNLILIQMSCLITYRGLISDFKIAVDHFIIFTHTFCLIYYLGNPKTKLIFEIVGLFGLFSLDSKLFCIHRLNGRSQLCDMKVSIKI